jgi:membrane-bound lytic murein transglycosylase B
MLVLPGSLAKLDVKGTKQLNYGNGDLNVAANALTSTAVFLKAHGWRAGVGYQPGEANFSAIQAWNAASVYQ